MAGNNGDGRRPRKGNAAGRGSDRRARIAAQRAAAQRAGRRKRVLIASGAIVVVAAVVVAFASLSGKSTSSNSAGGAPTPPTGSELTSIVNVTTSVPAGTLDQVGAGQVGAPPTTISGAPLTSGGKPEMLYMGGEYCPYCAAERWAMVVALSRFGTLSGLATTHSAARNGAGQAEPYPNTATWTFVHTHLASTYLTFTPVELYTNTPDPSTGGYTTLQTPTAAQQALITKYASGSIPFVDYGNKYLSVGVSYDPGVLKGLTWSQIATDLHTAASPVAKGVLGTANYMTAAICELTGNRPASACTSVVKSLQARL
jgi:hypothetical protein